MRRRERERERERERDPRLSPSCLIGSRMCFSCERTKERKRRESNMLNSVTTKPPNKEYAYVDLTNILMCTQLCKTR